MAVALATGMLAREWARGPPGFAWSLLAASAVLCLLTQRLGHDRAALALLYLLIAGLGWVRLDLAAREPPEHHLAHFLDEQPRLVKLRGVVANDPVMYISPAMPLCGQSDWLAKEERRGRCELDVEAVEADGRWLTTQGRARLTLYRPRARMGLRYGDRVVVTGSAAAPGEPTGPGQFDRARVFRRKGICASVAAEAKTVKVEERAQGNALMALASAARRAHREFVQATIGQRDKQAATMLRATVLGDRSELEEELEQAFQRSGTMHLLAISGLHVGIVAMLMWKAASLLGLGRSASGVLVLIVVSFYALAAGLTPSVTRATVMTWVFVGAIVGRRRPDPLQATALAAMVLLAWRPYDLFNAGFQLSFAAVVSISCLYGDFREALRRPETLEVRLLDEEDMGWPWRAARWLRRVALRAFVVSLAAWLGVFPLIAYYFHIFTPVTVLANLLAVPLLGLVVALAFLHLGLAALWAPLAALPGWLAQIATACLAWVVRHAAQLPLAWTYCAAPAWGWLAAYYLLGVLVLSHRRIGLNGKRAAALWLSGLTVYLFATLASARPDGLELTVLDVRHGSAAVLRYPDGTTVVADCGSYGRVDVGRHAMAPALWHWGVRRIDLLAISHADVDHINGIPALLERFAIGRAIYSPILARSEAGQQLLKMLDARGVPHGPAVAGDRLALGDGNILDVLAPSEWLLSALPKNQNENSLVLRAEHAGRRILLAGDTQDAAATVLLSSRADLRAHVLVVPHHGCKMARTPAFAAAVRPARAICSNKHERLPPETVAAYEAVGARVLATCWDGSVSVVIKDGGVRVETFRKREASAAD